MTVLATSFGATVETVSSVLKPVPVTKSPKIVKLKVPVKSDTDLKVEQIQGVMDNAPENVKGAKGFIELQNVLAYYNVRMPSDQIIVYINRIINERNDRFALTKFLVRSKETQQLYDDIANAL